MNRILLIEDDTGAQLLYRNRLTDLGYEVVVSSTGAMGLMEARAGHFDLFLVDIGLGSGIDGYEVCRRLKTIPKIHGVPVVLISGHVKTQEDLHRGYEAGCQSFLVKGDLTLLEDVVRAMLRIRSLQSDLAMQNRLLDQRNRKLEPERSANLEQALSNGAGRTGRELATARPDGVLLVDGEGVVSASDRGAHDLLGQGIEGKNLARVAPDSRLEAIVRNARTEPHEAIRFEVPERAGRAGHALTACVLPLVPSVDRAEPTLRVVLLFDAANRRALGAPAAALHAAWGPLIEAARVVFHPHALLGTSPALRERVAELARGDGPVLLQGPEGSGKALVARILHFSGPRSAPFIEFPCGAFAAQALELELFGATQATPAEECPGAFHLAHGGTLYLADVDRLPMPLQEHVLEFLAHGRIRRAGASNEERADVRLVAGTRAELALLVEQGRFHPELARHLAEERLELPPLKGRAADIELLAAHFVARYAHADGTHFSSEAAWVLTQHDWPGNVRVLESAVQAACATAHQPEIGVADLPQALADLHKRLTLRTGIKAPLPATKTAPPHEAEVLDSAVSLLDSYEKRALQHALRETGGDKLAAARLVGVGKSTFYRKLKQHGIR